MDRWSRLVMDKVRGGSLEGIGALEGFGGLERRIG